MTPELRLLLRIVSGALMLAYIAQLFIVTGEDVRDGRHDRGQNALFLQHGWMANDAWFKADKKRKTSAFRTPTARQALRSTLKVHGITDVFPHLNAANAKGVVSGWDDKQTAAFLDAMTGVRVMPWTGGEVNKQVFLQDPSWRKTFVESITRLIETHPRLAGIHLNIYPISSDNQNFLALLTELRSALPKGKRISVMINPPSTLLGMTEMEWAGKYIAEVSDRADQIVVPPWNSGHSWSPAYQFQVSTWTREVLSLSKGASVLIALPTFDSAGPKHDPSVESMGNVLLGMHAGLDMMGTLPANFQGTAPYAEWTMDEKEWEVYRSRYLKPGSF